ncbi:BREX-1 system adenine-specific DNA-methyltransferase PglX (plasmid) [Synechocystis sp. B12]|nr:BREX-1 system adenine-specific DNA-methyltransferase PglX [Synechocystis sp. B12]
MSNTAQFEKFNLNPDQLISGRLVASICQPLLKTAIEKRLELKAINSNNINDQSIKSEKLKEANKAVEIVKHIADSLVGESFAKANKVDNLKAEELGVAIESILIQEENVRKEKISSLKTDADRYLNYDLDSNAIASDPTKKRSTFHWIFEFPEVFLENDSPGFDAIVGNPPFMGGQKITGALGTPYRDFIQKFIANNVKGSADLVAYFFLQVCRLLRKKGHFGLVSTNTIAQGDTREVGLDQIATQGSIYRAVPSRPWSGTAALEVAYVWARKGQWQGKYYLDEKVVNGITPYLTIPGGATGKPYQLAVNSGKSFQGSIVLGMGFVLEPEEAESLIAKNLQNKDVLFPYLNGQDLNSNPDQAPSRWIINFFDWSLSPEHDDPKKQKGAPYASDYPDCLDIVEKLVKPEREVNKYSKSASKYWWLYERSRPELYEAIADLKRVLAIPLVSKYFNCAWQSTNMVYSHALGIIATNSSANFALIQNTFHEYWSREQGSSLETRMRYTPTDCFETFPFPQLTQTLQAELEAIGEAYYQHRQGIMSATQLGLTKTYNRFHDPNETDPDIEKLRQLHIEMDNTVAKAYQWDDSLTGDGLNHNFHDTKQGLRFTISEEARREILDRLLQLNHQRYKEEVAQGLHNKKGKKKASKPKQSAPANQLDLKF